PGPRRYGSLKDGEATHGRITREAREFPLERSESQIEYSRRKLGGPALDHRNIDASECQPGDELQLPRRLGAGYSPDGSSRDIGGGISKVRVIERIKELEAVLKSEPFSHLCVLREREIPVLDARSVEETPSDIPQRACRSNRKSSRVKPSVNLPLVCR